MIKSIKNLDEFPLTIKWRLTDCCNYHCSYCIRSGKRENLVRVKDDNHLILETMPEINRIIKEKGVITKIQLIGGEVTLLDLPRIISELYNSNKMYIKRINFTTNFSKSVDYFNSLFKLCHELGVELSVTCSFHPEHTTLERFMSKIKELTLYPSSIFKVEMVSTENNKDLVSRFIDLCILNHVIYTVDPDFRDPNRNNLIADSSEDKDDRYEVTTEDGIYYCKSTRELTRRFGNGKVISLSGYKCSLDYDTINIDKNIHVGFVEGRPGCKNNEPVSRFHFKDSLSLCCKGCALCGAMSVYKE